MTYMLWLNIAILVPYMMLVAGTHDKRLSERLQLDGDLSLDKAVTIIWQSETVHQQELFLHGSDTIQFPIDAVKTSRGTCKNTSNTG